MGIARGGSIPLDRTNSPLFADPLLALCYLVGALVNTQIGALSFERLESLMRDNLPGYQIIVSLLRGIAGDPNFGIARFEVCFALIARPSRAGADALGEGALPAN